MLKKTVRASINAVPWRWRGVIKRIPLIAPLQRWLLARSLDNEEFVHTVDAGPAKGLRYLIRMPDDKLIWTGTWELEFSAALASAVAPGDVCYDIGGYHGFFSGVFAQAKAGQVHTFEPLPINCARIRKLIELNPALPLHLTQAAVGATPGQAEFRIMPETTMGKLKTSTFQPAAQSLESIIVQVCQIDDLVAAGKTKPPNVIKVDVEGAEADVLRGAAATLRRQRPKLFIEIHSRGLMQECSALLAEAGYKLAVLETGRAPDGRTEPEICHLIGTP